MGWSDLTLNGVMNSIFQAGATRGTSIPRSKSSPTNRARRLRALAWLVATCALAGCSTFERDWRDARETPRFQDDMAGRWEGTWRSDRNGHNDQLRAVIATGSNGVYSTQFHAKYKIGIFRFSFGYTVPLQVERTNDTYRFQSEADLGWLGGGVYRYEGAATGTNFFSTYRSKYDHGKFEMRRPLVSNQP